MSIVFDPVRDWGWPQPRACGCVNRRPDGTCCAEPPAPEPVANIIKRHNDFVREVREGYELRHRTMRDPMILALEWLCERFGRKPRIRVKAGREVVA